MFAGLIPAPTNRESPERALPGWARQHDAHEGPGCV